LKWHPPLDGPVEDNPPVDNLGDNNPASPPLGGSVEDNLADNNNPTPPAFVRQIFTLKVSDVMKFRGQFERVMLREKSTWCYHLRLMTLTIRELMMTLGEAM
jgi:hypothetical protein